MSTIHVKRGVEFKARLYDQQNPKPWLEEVGKKLEEQGVSVKVGDGAGALDLRNAADLVAFYERYESDPAGTSTAVGIPEGRDLREYVSDLIEALDDVVKRSSELTSGDTVDLTTQGELAKTLGLETRSQTYASNSTTFETTAPQQGTMTVLGVQLGRASAIADPFDGVPVITGATFGTGRQASGRNALEFETVRKLEGLEGQDLVRLLNGPDGDRALRRMRKASDQEAYTLGYRGIGFDQMRWDSRAHRTREMNPYVSLTVENDRMEVDTDDNEYEVSQGTDYFWDRYYVGVDANDPSADVLLDNKMSVRARVRYDQPGEPRRVLIQSKIGSEVDDNGMKSAAKQDIRRDSPTSTQVEMLDEATRSGVIAWNGGTGQPIEALAEVHAELAERGQLPDVGPHEEVLQLEIGAHVFSVRSRYHLNETSSTAQRNLFEQGDAWRTEVKAQVEASTTLPQSQKDELTRLIAGIDDRSLIADRVRDRFAELDPNVNAADVDAAALDAFWPTASRSSDKTANLKRRAVADAIKAVHNELAEALDDVRQEIAGSREPDAEQFDLADELVDFLKTKHTDMALTTTFGPFLEKMDEAPDQVALMEEFGQWLADEENDRSVLDAPDKTAAFVGLRKNMVNEHLDILHRQLEAAGTMAQSMWFDDARRVWADASPRTSNFLIDTFDFVMNISNDQWESLTPEQRDGRENIPADKTFGASIISEVQIELGYEEPYINAINKAKTGLDGARAGFFMDFALADSFSNVVADEPATFQRFLEEVMAQPDFDRQTTLDRLNQIAESRGSPVRFDDESLGRLKPEMFTTDRQNASVDGHGELVQDLEMATWLWETVTGAQNSVADLRGRRVINEAEDAGATGNLAWVESNMSKGETALTNRP